MYAPAEALQGSNSYLPIWQYYFFYLSPCFVHLIGKHNIVDFAAGGMLTACTT